MKYTRIQKAGNVSIEHVVEGDYEEVLALFTELEAKEVLENQSIDWATSTNTTNFINQ